MFSFYNRHNNNLYNKLVELSRNIFFYKELRLKDNFETRIILIFLHFSIILIRFKEMKKIPFSQKIFDNIFLNIEYHLRELGQGDVTANKNMKRLNKIFYDILLKLKIEDKKKFEINLSIISRHLAIESEDKSNIVKIAKYLTSFYEFCFELNHESMLKGLINFKYIK